MKFNSQICTTREQSKRLLALGLKKETADMYQIKRVKDYDGNDIPEEWQSWTASFHGAKVGPGLEVYETIPAWSLHRLIEMMPEMIKDNIEEMLYHLSINHDSVFYENKSFDLCQFIGDNLYENIVDCIEWLIKEGYFNKEYLEE